METLDEKRPYHDSLDNAFGTYLWTISVSPVKGGYEYLQVKGLDIISNDALRMHITAFYEGDISVIKEENEVWSNNMQQMISYPYHLELFRTYYPSGHITGSDVFARPINDSALLLDEKFRNINVEIMANRKWNIFSLRDILSKTEQLVKDTYPEVARLNNG